MPVLLTGAAGFIGFHTANALLTRGEEVIGVDNLNDYYDVTLKQARLNQLLKFENFCFKKINIVDREPMLALSKLNITHIVHFAAQAGVRYSLQNPYAYVESNIMGHVVMWELARQCSNMKHFVYASSSSVYGGNTKIPFSIDDPVDKPVSLYAATKRSDELISWTYAHLYKIPTTGLRFFTVYGPWGRPDMAAYLFVQQILRDQPIKVFNHGNMRRDFTYIDDIVQGVLATLGHPPTQTSTDSLTRLYNLGNAHPENLLDFIAIIEQIIGKKARIDLQPLQPGDVAETYADIKASQRDLGFQPRIELQEGIPRFIEWYKQYHGY